MQKKNNFKSRVNLGKGKQISAREPLLPCNKCEKSHGSIPCLFDQNIYVGSQDIMPRIAIPGNHWTILFPDHKLKEEYSLLVERRQLNPLTWSKVHVFLKMLIITLFESGATHSFISIDCVKKLDMPFDLLISTPTKGKVPISQACLNCPI